tara:strand:- start:12854 stop:13018 length:165 start_codon:yes stop_codon:yes gene_type:complete
MEILQVLFTIALIWAFIQGFREGLEGKYDDCLPDYLYYRDNKSGIGFGIKTKRK